jgi:tetratricopeptide (TPR) repeat protein
MKIICAYCSASKDPDKGLVPAYKRYISNRIVKVQEIAAEQEDTNFCILSGKFGLVKWDHPLPLYDHLLISEEVPQLVEKVCNQIMEMGTTQVDFYTRSILNDNKISPYINTIEQACKKCNVPISIFYVDEPRKNSAIRNWKQIMEMAAEAGQELVLNRSRGESEFIELLSQYPDDGMVYFQRAKAYEMIGELGLTKNDYKSASELFPLTRWQHEAQLAIENIDREFSSGGTVIEARRRVSNFNNIDPRIKDDVIKTLDKAITEASGCAIDISKCVVDIIKVILRKQNIRETNSLENDIYLLKNKGIMPEIITNHKNTIRILRNRAAHPVGPEYKFQAKDVYPRITALVAILEWHNSTIK